MLRLNKKGFTLVEIMIVVAIIGLLAAIAIPNFVRARQTAQTNTCYNNLRLIDASKEQYALENNMTTGDTIATASTVLAPYFKGNAWPNCPANGVYAEGLIGTVPSCSVHGTVP